MKVKKVVLAYSGGLDTSVILPWLKETLGCEVVAFIADLGQGEELGSAKERARLSGAVKVICKDLRKEFVESYVFRTLRAGAAYEGSYLLGTSLARPVIAKAQIEVAEEEQADAVAHGATGKGNDQVRFEMAYMALNPRLAIISPWKDPRWPMRSREDMIAYAKSHKIPIEVSNKKIYSRDRNIWHLSHEGGDLESTTAEARKEMFVLTVSPEDAPDRATYVEVEFEKGIPVGMNGKTMDGVSLVERLNEIGGANAVGRVDLVENRVVGIKSRGVYETPGGTILSFAHRQLEQICLDREALHYKDVLSQKYAEIVYYGQWFTPLREALDAFFARAEEPVTGRARVKLYKGNCTPAGTSSPNSLYSEELASFTMGESYNQADAGGFIRLMGLPYKVQAMLRRKKKP